MATFKQECIHCNSLIERDSHFCPKCGSHSPFGYACPTCLRMVTRDDAVCAGCGRGLFIDCPHCGGYTFAGERCDSCKHDLTVVCQNPRCLAPQFFENQRCTACGKKIKHPKRK